MWLPLACNKLARAQIASCRINYLRRASDILSEALNSQKRDSGPTGLVLSGLSRTQHSVFALARSSISDNPARAIILKCDCSAESTHQDPASDGLPPVVYSVGCHRCGACLVACRADPSGRPVDRPTVNRGPHSAPLAGLGSPHSVSRTLQIPSAQPNLARSAARCYGRGGRALLPAPWIRLARDPNRCRRRFGRRSHSRSFHHHAATCKEPIFRNGPLCPPQGCGVHTGTGGRIRPRQARILEIYLNVVEWGPGIYGAESACRYYDGIAARNIGREQAARLAAILPAPLKRRPERMNNYSARILERMRQINW